MYSARCGDGRRPAPWRAAETDTDGDEPAPGPIESAEDWLNCSLNKAGATMLALPDREMPAGFRVAWPDYRHSAAEAYGCGKVRLRGAVPTSAQISRMDRAYGWVQLLAGAHDQVVRWRRIVCLRSLCDPVTRRHLYSWERIGEVLGYSRTWCQIEHKFALRLICALIAAKK